tara:strand:+ start:367 stop:1770 length:1404 start_codon:yes stop_codon:yes gene_type:complete
MKKSELRNIIRESIKSLSDSYSLPLHENERSIEEKQKGIWYNRCCNLMCDRCSAACRGPVCDGWSEKRGEEQINEQESGCPAPMVIPVDPNQPEMAGPMHAWRPCRPVFPRLSNWTAPGYFASHQDCGTPGNTNPYPTPGCPTHQSAVNQFYASMGSPSVGEVVEIDHTACFGNETICLEYLGLVQQSNTYVLHFYNNVVAHDGCETSPCAERPRPEIDGIRNCCDPKEEYTLAPSSAAIFNGMGVQPGEAGIFNFTFAPGSTPPNTGYKCWEFIIGAEGPITGYQYAGGYGGMFTDCDTLQQNFPPNPFIDQCCERRDPPERKGCLDKSALNYGDCCPPNHNNPNCVPTIHNDECCKYDVMDPNEKGCLDQNATNYMECCNGDPNCTPTIQFDACCKFDRDEPCPPLECPPLQIWDPIRCRCVCEHPISCEPPLVYNWTTCKCGDPTVEPPNLEEISRMQKLANIK